MQRLLRASFAFAVLTGFMSSGSDAFAAPAPPCQADIALVIDNSLSGKRGASERRTALAEAIPQMLGRLGAGARVAIASFGQLDHDRALLRLGMASDAGHRREVLSYLDGLAFDERGTDVRDGLDSGFNLVNKSSESRRRVVVLFTDGKTVRIWAARPDVWRCATRASRQGRLSEPHGRKTHARGERTTTTTGRIRPVLTILAAGGTLVLTYMTTYMT